MNIQLLPSDWLTRYTSDGSGTGPRFTWSGHPWISPKLPPTLEPPLPIFDVLTHGKKIVDFLFNPYIRQAQSITIECGLETLE
jgi:hypothetical protein